MSSRKPLLIIGLDGATWTVLVPLMEANGMPCLKKLVANGASGILLSTVPPITPAAWTTFLTGKQPGEHGIIDFERYDPFSNRLLMNSTRCLEHVRNLWQILGGHGLRVGSVNVPMTYPPMAVNGFMVSGFEAPGPQSDFVYPPELREEILERWSDPTLRAKWRHSAIFRTATFRKNLRYISNSFAQGAQMTRFLGDRFGWDVLMVVFKLTDNLQHKAWKYLDPRWIDRHPKRSAMVRDCFADADRAVNQLVDYAAQKDANVMIVSDHGHGSLEGKVQPNLLLKRWGYLTLSGAASRQATRLRYLRDRAYGRTHRFARHGDIAHDLAVDFSRTRAAVMHAGMAGFLYINLRGRQPQGIVAADDYESLRDELIARFRGDECRVMDPSGMTVELFPQVHKPEELYGCEREDQPWMPDLILIPHDGLAVVRRIKGPSVVRWLSYARMEGTHRPEGIFVAGGPDVRCTNAVHAHLVDCAPTILALLGLPIPEDMHGRVIQEIFRQPAVVTRDRAFAGKPSHHPESQGVYSQAELQEVSRRLADLGYLE